MKICKLKLKDVLSDYEIREQEFEYAGTSGIAEFLGWKIIFFHKMSDLGNTASVFFGEIDNTELVCIANMILNLGGFKVRFGDSISKIKSIYGNPDFIDDIFEDIIRYNYISSSNLYMAFGFKDDKLLCLEIITDQSMIRDVIATRKPDNL